MFSRELFKMMPHVSNIGMKRWLALSQNDRLFFVKLKLQGLSGMLEYLS